MSTTLLDKITEIKSKETPDQMSFDELVRWICLCQAVTYIDKKASELGVDFDRYVSLKPKIIRDFIEETFHSTRANLILSNNIRVD